MRAEQLPGQLLLGIQIQQSHYGAEHGTISWNFGAVDFFGAVYFAPQFTESAFDKAELLAAVNILAVFLQIALFTGFANPFPDFDRFFLELG